MRMVLACLNVFLRAGLWGSLLCVGVWVVPLLFITISPKSLAGIMAAKLFGIEALWAGVTGLFVLLCGVWVQCKKRTWTRLMRLERWASLGLCISSQALSEWVMVKIMEAAPDERAYWHAWGSFLYVIMGAMSTLLLARWVVGAGRHEADQPLGMSFNPEKTS